MSTVFRRNRKGSDRDILRLNSLGLSLSTVGAKLNCHPTSITLRLKSLNVAPADTRRAFMDDIFKQLPDDHQDDIADLLENQKLCSIKDYICDLIRNDVEKRRHNQPPTADLTFA